MKIQSSILKYVECSNCNTVGKIESVGNYTQVFHLFDNNGESIDVRRNYVTLECMECAKVYYVLIVSEQ